MTNLLERLDAEAGRGAHNRVGQVELDVGQQILVQQLAGWETCAAHTEKLPPNQLRFGLGVVCRLADKLAVHLVAKLAALETVGHHALDGEDLLILPQLALQNEAA